MWQRDGSGNGTNGGEERLAPPQDIRQKMLDQIKREEGMCWAFDRIVIFRSQN